MVANALTVEYRPTPAATADTFARGKLCAAEAARTARFGSSIAASPDGNVPLNTPAPCRHGSSTTIDRDDRTQGWPAAERDSCRIEDQRHVPRQLWICRSRTAKPVRRSCGLDEEGFARRKAHRGAIAIGVNQPLHRYHLSLSALQVLYLTIGLQARGRARVLCFATPPGPSDASHWEPVYVSKSRGDRAPH